MTTETSNDWGENVFEKLSREIHQMQVNDAIHSDWLEHPQGFLLKPDFKRKEQHMGAGGKKLLTGVRGLHFRLPGAATYRARWFVLDGMYLRYYKSENDEQEAGSIHLASVNAVLPSRVADAPEHSLDLVCADRIYTVAGNNREDMVRWATVLTLVLQGAYRPRNVRRRDSIVPRPNRLQRQGSSSAGSDRAQTPPMEQSEALRSIIDVDDVVVNEKIVTVTFEDEGKLFLVLQGTIEDEVMVTGFEAMIGGGRGPAESSGAIQVGDILVSINDDYFTTIKFSEAVDKIAQSERPLTLRFLRFDTPERSDSRKVTEGWVLAKESAASRYRVRMLQFRGSELSLYKPALHSGRQPHRSARIKISDITDIRATYDERDISKAEIQGHSKQWGVTLQSASSIFSFYTKSKEDQTQWIDLIKNSPLSNGQLRQVPIQVHPVCVVSLDVAANEDTLLEGDVLKLSELTKKLESRYCVIQADGKMRYYRASSDQRILGTVRLEHVVSIVLEEVVSNNSTTWTLEIVFVVATLTQKYKRSMGLSFETREKVIEWARTIEIQAKNLSGREFDLSVGKAKAQEGSRIISHVDFDCCNWFYVKCMKKVGLEAYHLRYLLLRGSEVLFYKYDVVNDDDQVICPSGRIDLRSIKDIRESDPNSMDTHEFSLELVTSKNKIHVIVAPTFEQQQKWISQLIWASDYYYIQDYEDNEEGQTEVPDQKISIQDWIHIGIDSGRVFGIITESIFAYYETEEAVVDEWGDPLNWIRGTSIVSVHGRQDDPTSFQLEINNGEALNFTLDSAEQAKRWMMALCCCGNLVLHENLTSAIPEEVFIWKLDALNNTYRRRHFSLRNDELMYRSADKYCRLIGKVDLNCITKITLSHMTGSSSDRMASFHLDIEVNDHNGDVTPLTLAFETMDELEKFATSLYAMTKNCNQGLEFPPLEAIQELPETLVKGATFEMPNENPQPVSSLQQPRGWLHYQTPGSRIRLRYFVLWGYELCVYKHEVTPEETMALRYHVIDCRQLKTVQQLYSGAPENAIQVELSSQMFLIIPKTDADGQMWRDALIETKRLHGGMCTDEFQLDPIEEQLRVTSLRQGNVEQWNGTAWQSKYYVLTEARLLVFTCAMDLYDEDPDIIESVTTKSILDIRSIEKNEKNSTFQLELQCTRTILVQTETEESCFEWMKALCFANGKLELRRNAMNHLWGSVNQIATMSRHSSFQVSQQHIRSPDTRRRSTAAQRRTSELLIRRRLTVAEN